MNKYNKADLISLILFLIPILVMIGCRYFLPIGNHYSIEWARFANTITGAQISMILAIPCAISIVLFYEKITQ